MKRLFIKKEELGGGERLIPVIFALAWPTMLEQLMQTAVQYIDTAMVGSLGTDATAAVGSTTTVNWLVGSTLSAFGVGFLAYVSQAYGAGEKQRAARATAQSVLVTLLAGLVFTAVTVGLSPFVPRWMQVDPAIEGIASRYFMILYLPMLFRAATIIFGTVLRAAGDTKTPMRVGIVVNLVNVVGNFFLIYETRTRRLFGLQVTLPGAGLGVPGAAIASAVSFVVGGVLITVALLRHREISPIGYSLKPDREILVPCMQVALPNMLQRFCTSFGYVVFASMINSLGEISTAAHTIANTVESAFYIPGYGMMTAAATLTGNCIGARNAPRLRKMTRTIIAVETAMMTASGALLFVFARLMSGVFSADGQVLSLSTLVLRMVALSEPFYGIAIVIEGMLQGAGETKKPFYFNVGCMWGIRILGTFVCTRLLHYGLVSAWGCMIGNNVLLMLLYVLYFKSGVLDRAVHGIADDA